MALPLQMNRPRADEEEYWHSSKCRAFTFDDEDDELCQVGAGCPAGPPRGCPVRRPEASPPCLSAAEGVQAGGEQPAGHRRR